MTNIMIIHLIFGVLDACLHKWYSKKIKCLKENLILTNLLKLLEY